MAKKVLYNGNDGKLETTLDYEIVNGEFYIRETTKVLGKKELLFKDDTEMTYKLNKENTDKLLSIISEKELIKKFNNQDSFYDFRDFIDNNGIEHEFIAVDK